MENVATRCEVSGVLSHLILKKKWSISRVAQQNVALSGISALGYLFMNNSLSVSKLQIGSHIFFGKYAIYLGVVYSHWSNRVPASNFKEIIKKLGLNFN